MMHADRPKVEPKPCSTAPQRVQFTDHGKIHAEGDARGEAPNERIVFRCETTGIGMTDEADDQLFEAFTQASIPCTRPFGGNRGWAWYQRASANDGRGHTVESEMG